MTRRTLMLMLMRKLRLRLRFWERLKQLAVGIRRWLMRMGMQRRSCSRLWMLQR